MRIGIVGAGGMGNVHARHHRNIPNVEPAVFDIDPERRKTLSEKWKIEEKDSLEETLRWADAIDLCVPTPLHLELGLKVIAAGKALLVEKPIAGTVEDAAKLVSAARKASVPLMPAHVVRYFPEFRKAHEAVENGEIGNPAAARLRRGGGMPKGAGLWFSDHSKSGGVLLDLAIHDFDWLRWTLGEVKSLFAKSLGAIKGQGPDYALTTLQFDSGAIAHVESTWMDPSGFRVALEVCGSGGMIEYDSRLTLSLRTSIEGSPTVSEAPLDSMDDPYYNQLKGFVYAIQEGKEPPITGFDGLMAVSIATAAIESAKTGKVVAPARLI